MRWKDATCPNNPNADFSEIGKEIGVTKQRACQIYQIAMRKFVKRLKILGIYQDFLEYYGDAIHRDDDSHYASRFRG